jgi:hypothetical protein
MDMSSSIASAVNLGRCFVVGGLVASLVLSAGALAQVSEWETTRVDSKSEALDRANGFAGFATQSHYVTPPTESIAPVEFFRDSAVRISPNPIDSTSAWVVSFRDLRLEFYKGGGLLTKWQIVKSYSVAIHSESGRLLRIDGTSEHSGDSCCQTSVEAYGNPRLLWEGVVSLCKSPDPPPISFAEALAANPHVQPSQARAITAYLVEWASSPDSLPKTC